MNRSSEQTAEEEVAEAVFIQVCDFYPKLILLLLMEPWWNYT
jgi:hypothetical protein